MNELVRHQDKVVAKGYLRRVGAGGAKRPEQFWNDESEIDRLMDLFARATRCGEVTKAQEGIRMPASSPEVQRRRRRGGKRARLGKGTKDGTKQRLFPEIGVTVDDPNRKSIQFTPVTHQ